MDEKEWLECTDPLRMIDALQNRATERKLRLFAIAAWRQRFAKYLPANPAQDPTDPGIEALALAERYADGPVAREELEETARKAADFGERFLDANFGHTEPFLAYVAAAGLLGPSATAAARSLSFLSDPVDVRAAQACLLRDIFGSPSHSLTLKRSWLTHQEGIVQRLAEDIYERRIMPAGTFDPDRLAVLADALEESGCSDPAILDHLRSPGAHVRGCHIVDRLTESSGPCEG
jgi:hypothetical protein